LVQKLREDRTMAIIRIEIETENEAFTDDMGAEVGRILTKLAGDFRVHGEPSSPRLRDYNGNTVGKVSVS
jgi:hypothetical protein